MAAISVSENEQNLESVTTIIIAHIKPDKAREYEQWLRGINEDATQFAGFQGATILRPNDKSHQYPEYVVVVKFATYSDLRRWEHQHGVVPDVRERGRDDRPGGVLSHQQREFLLSELVCDHLFCAARMMVDQRHDRLVPGRGSPGQHAQHGSDCPATAAASAKIEYECVA